MSATQDTKPVTITPSFVMNLQTQEKQFLPNVVPSMKIQSIRNNTSDTV